MPLPHYKRMTEVVFIVNDEINFSYDFHQEDIQIDETSFTLKNVSNLDRNILLSQLREVRLEKLLNDIDVPIQVIITQYDRIGLVSKRHNYKAYLDSDFTFNIKWAQIDSL